MDTKAITAVKMPYKAYYGTRYEVRRVLEIQHGTNIDLILLDDGNLHVRLTGEGRKLLRELKSDPRIVNASYAEEIMLHELLGDEFLCNGWDMAFTASEWGHMSEDVCLSDGHTVEDDGTHTCTRMWHDIYTATLALLPRLEFGDLIFYWFGMDDPKRPTHLW